MKVTVNIYAYLRYYLPEPEKNMQEKVWDLPEGAMVKNVLDRLRLPKEVRVTVLVNSNSVDLKALLKEGDIVHILPQMVGG